jgi:hypothetical protein
VVRGGALGHGVRKFPFDAALYERGVDGYHFASVKETDAGKTCFNFKSDPEPEVVGELERLTQPGIALE